MYKAQAAASRFVNGNKHCGTKLQFFNYPIEADSKCQERIFSPDFFIVFLKAEIKFQPLGVKQFLFICKIFCKQWNKTFYFD